MPAQRPERHRLSGLHGLHVLQGLGYRIQRKARRREALRQIRALLPLRSVLILCTANRVRSPFAEAWLKRAAPSLDVQSRGILEGGEPVPPESEHVARAMGLELGEHVSKRLEPAELVGAPLVLAMEQEMVASFKRRFPAVASRIVLLGDLDPEADTGRDIEDPYLLSVDEYEVAYARIARCLDNLVPLILPVDPGTVTQHG